MDFRGRDKEDQPDTFTSQPHNSIESKIHVVLGQSGARLPLVNMPIPVCEKVALLIELSTRLRGVQGGGSGRFEGQSQNNSHCSQDTLISIGSGSSHHIFSRSVCIAREPKAAMVGDDC